jgi:hypothetical protein
VSYARYSQYFHFSMRLNDASEMFSGEPLQRQHDGNSSEVAEAADGEK